MSTIEKGNEQGLEDDPQAQPLTDEQAEVFQRLRRLQSDIEEQSHWVAVAANQVAEALHQGRKVSPELMSHVRAQILLAHLQLDDLEQLLDALP